MKKYIRYKLFSLLYNKSRQDKFNSFSGFTMVEAISTLLIGSIILIFAMNGFASVRQILVGDKDKTEVNQRLRSIFGTIGPDIQQTGEGLISDPKFPAIQIRQTIIPNTTNQTTSQIIIRKAITPTTLTVCDRIVSGTTNRLRVIDQNNPDGSCKIISETNGWPQNLTNWRNQRNQKGGTIKAYIYDRNGNGEFFDYRGEQTRNSLGNIMTPSALNPPHTVDLITNNPTWKNTYEVGSIVYLMEERLYQVKDNQLQLVINDSDTYYLTENVEKLDVKVILQKDATSSQFTCTTIPPVSSRHCNPTFSGTYSWSQIKYVNITAQLLPGEDSNSNSAGILKDNLKLSQQFFPRNRLSF